MFVESTSETKTSTTAAETMPLSPAAMQTASVVPTSQPYDGKGKYDSEF